MTQEAPGLGPAEELGVLSSAIAMIMMMMKVVVTMVIVVIMMLLVMVVMVMMTMTIVMVVMMVVMMLVVMMLEIKMLMARRMVVTSRPRVKATELPLCSGWSLDPGPSCQVQILHLPCSSPMILSLFLDLSVPLFPQL